jgi:hypothetical protein
MRRWADFGDAAFVGQFALTVQSAIAPSGVTYFLAPEDVLTQAHGPPADACRSRATYMGRGSAASRRCVRCRPRHPGGAVDKCSGWIEKTDGDIHNLARMPEQRACAALHQPERRRRSGLGLPAHRTQRSRRRLAPSAQRYDKVDNWLAKCNAVASAAWQATPWVRENDQHSL